MPQHLVRSPEPDEIGRKNAKTLRGQQRDHMPPQVAPGRLTVQQQHGAAIARAFVDVMQAQARLQQVILRLIRKIGQCGEPFIRRAIDLHSDFLPVYYLPSWRGFTGCEKGKAIVYHQLV